MTQVPSAATNVTHEMTLEPLATIDITRQIEEPCDIKAITHQTVKEASAVTDITQQTLEEPSATIVTTQPTVKEPSSVTVIIEHTIEEQRPVADIIQQTVENQSALTEAIQRTIDEQSVTDGTRQTVEESNAATNITQITGEERNSITDGILQTTEEQSAIKDDSRETMKDLIDFTDNAQQTIKKTYVVRDTTQRKFGYAQLSWEIENFFFATENKEWEISSPEFDVEGFCVTRWRLILKVKKINDGNDRNAYICLERLDGQNDTRDIRVCWNVWHKIAGEELPLCDSENLIKSNCLLAVLIKNFELFERSLQVRACTIIFLEAFILVRSKENEVVFKRSEDHGVKRLSEDISIAYSISQHQSDVIEYESFSDLKINTEGYPLICHKPILCARNKSLNMVIDDNRYKSEIDLNFSKGKAARKIFQYLYSGNLTHILRMPSILIDKAINYLSIDELQCYYLKDSIRLLTRFEAEEVYFKWVVMDLKSGENFLFSPIFSREKFGLVLRLRLGLNKDFPLSKDFLSLKLEVIEGNQVPEFYFICGIGNFDRHIINPRSMQWTSGCEAEILNFTPKSVLRDSSITFNDTITIVCSIYIPKGTKYLSVVKTQKCLRPELDHERHYRLLSAQLNTLFETGKHTDLELQCQEETFKVHKCVLFARSPVLRRAIRHLHNLEGKKSKGISMDDFDPKILRIILRYIYSGILNCEKEDLLAVYKGSKLLSMVTLRNQLYHLLLNNLDVSNAIGTLELAVENADFRLVEPVCRFMKNNITEIQLQKNWESFMKKKESLYEKLKEKARGYLKVRENV